jgi:hypothetical protein
VNGLPAKEVGDSITLGTYRGEPVVYKRSVYFDDGGGHMMARWRVTDTVHSAAPPSVDGRYYVIPTMPDRKLMAPGENDNLREMALWGVSPLAETDFSWLKRELEKRLPGVEWAA